MDRAIEKTRRPVWQWVVICLVGASVFWWISQLLADASISTYRVPESQLVISEVSLGDFEDLIPIRGTIQPLESVFLDAVIGGSVEEVLVEEGSYVQAGQPLVQLSNTSTRLSAAQADAQTTDQLNNLTNIATNFRYQKLATERQIIDTEFRIVTLTRQRGRFSQLLDSNLVSKEEYDTISDELLYQEKVLKNLKERQEVETEEREARSEQIALQMTLLQQNLEISQRSFESLLVKAPISGQLTSFQAEPGESKQTGERLGQIDVVDEYKIVAQIDEFYVSRVQPGQVAKFTLDGISYKATVLKVYPEIVSGTFEIDIVFQTQPPSSIRRGQSIQMELTLGSPQQSLLLPLGGFIQDTGGNWVFVLDEAGEYAVRKNISAGRRNNRHIEIREGLEPGDRVVTSGYSQLDDVERLKLVR